MRQNGCSATCFCHRSLGLHRAPQCCAELGFRLLALFDEPVRGIVPVLGKDVGSSGAKACKMPDMDFVTPEEASQAVAVFMAETGMRADLAAPRHTRFEKRKIGIRLLKHATSTPCWFSRGMSDQSGAGVGRIAF